MSIFFFLDLKIVLFWKINWRETYVKLINNFNNLLKRSKRLHKVTLFGNEVEVTRNLGHLLFIDSLIVFFITLHILKYYILTQYIYWFNSLYLEN